MKRIERIVTKSVMVQISPRVIVAADTITEVSIDPHPDATKAPTWLGHVTTVNPITGAETRHDLVFDDGDLAEIWLRELKDNLNTVMDETTTETEI